MRAAPGLKHLVVISDGLALATHPDSSVFLEPLSKAAAAAGVQVSVLSGEGDGVDIANTNGLTGKDRLEDARALRSSIETIAEMTGGTYEQVIGLADPAFARVALASSALYQLGVEAGEDTAPGRDYALSVHVSRSGLTVRANRHAVAPGETPPVPVETQLRQAIGSGAPLFGVPLTVGTALRRGEAPSQVAIEANVAVPAGVQGPLTLVFAIGDQQGLVKSGRTTIAAPGAAGDYRASLDLSVPPGVYHLRFAVASADSKVGSVQTTVTAQLNHVGPFLAGDLETGWAGADRTPEFLALERVPAGATSLLASLSLYPDGSDSVLPGATVHIALLNLLNGTETPVVQRDAVLSNPAGTVQADAQLPLQGVAAGTYTLRATIGVAGKPVGTVSTTVRISGPSGSN